MLHHLMLMLLVGLGFITVFLFEEVLLGEIWAALFRAAAKGVAYLTGRPSP